MRKEKKARKQKFGKSFIACGTTNGKVIIWNVDRKEVVREISTGTGNPVYVDFVNPTTLLLGSKPKFLATCLFTEGEKTLRYQITFTFLLTTIEAISILEKMG